MHPASPLDKPNEEFHRILKRIQSDSQVGIDAPLTHAIIIDCLEQIIQRLDKLEDYLKREAV